MVFAGTVVVTGACICLVTQVGMYTEIGKVYEQIHIAAQSEEDTPLKKKLNEYGEVLTMIIGIIRVLVWAIDVISFSLGNMLMGCQRISTFCSKNVPTILRLQWHWLWLQFQKDCLQ